MTTQTTLSFRHTSLDSDVVGKLFPGQPSLSRLADTSNGFHFRVVLRQSNARTTHGHVLHEAKEIEGVGVHSQNLATSLGASLSGSEKHSARLVISMKDHTGPTDQVVAKQLIEFRVLRIYELETAGVDDGS